MRAATLLALMGVSRPIYNLNILNEAILIVLSNHTNIMLLPASHVTYTVYNFTDLINNSVCLSVCLSDIDGMQFGWTWVDLAKIPPNQNIGDFGRGSSGVESESE